MALAECDEGVAMVKIARFAWMAVALLFLSSAGCTSGGLGGGSTTAPPVCGAGLPSMLKVLGGDWDLFNTAVIETGRCGVLTAGYAGGGATDVVLSRTDPTGPT